MRRFFHPVTGIFIALFGILLFVGRSRLFRDPGTFWHTVVGENILATGAFPTTDTFSFTFFGQPWIAYHWLSECLMAAIHRVAGLDGLLVVTVAGLALLYAWVAWRWMRVGFHWSIACVGIALAIVASIHNWHVRPHMFTPALLGIVYAILIDVESGRRTWKATLWLPPLFLFWTNVHGGALGGLATYGFILGGWTVLWLAKQPGTLQSGRGVAIAWVIFLVSVGTIVVTPYGSQVSAYWLRILQLDLPEVIQEHAPLDPSQPAGFAIIGFFVVYLVAFFGTLPNRPKVTWFVPLIWFALSCMRNRQGPLFGMVAALALADLFPYTVFARRLMAKGSDLFMPSAKEAPVLGWHAWVLPAILSLGAFAYVAMPSERPQLVQLDAQYWPVELLPELQAIPPGSKLFNRLNYGGFLIYHVPKVPIFIDDRCELYGNNFLGVYAEAERNRPDTLQRWALQYGFTHALVETGSPFDQFLEKQNRYCELVKRTQAATLYKRKGF